ncbi:flavodoxin family protein [bacterium]|nr:flavodoxin family protein [bacterium]
MKILSIMGSPRKGDSYKITKIFEEKLSALEKVEFKYLFLGDINLEYCRGCSICMKKGEEFCPSKDITLNSSLTPQKPNFLFYGQIRVSRIFLAPRF